MLRDDQLWYKDNLFNLRYIVAPQEQAPPEFARLIGAYGRHKLYQVETSGYFDLVDSNITVYGDPHGWFWMAETWMVSKLVEMRQHPVIVLGKRAEGDEDWISMREAQVILPSLDPPRREPCGKILSEGGKGNLYSVTFEAGRACWLMMKQTFHPWLACHPGRTAGPDKHAGS